MAQHNDKPDADNVSEIGFKQFLVDSPLTRVAPPKRAAGTAAAAAPPPRIVVTAEHAEQLAAGIGASPSSSSATAAGPAPAGGGEAQGGPQRPVPPCGYGSLFMHYLLDGEDPRPPGTRWVPAARADDYPCPAAWPAVRARRRRQQQSLLPLLCTERPGTD